MPGLDLGGVFQTLGWRVDRSGQREYEREQQRLKAQSARPIEQELGYDIDETELRRYRAQLDRVRAESARKDRFKAQLGADFDESAFRAFTRAGQDTEKVVSRLADAFGGGGDSLRVNLAGVSGAFGNVALGAATVLPVMIGVGGAAVALGSSLAAAAAGAAAVGIGAAAAVGPLAALGGALIQRLGVVKDAYTALQSEQQHSGVEAQASAAQQRSAADAIAAAHQGVETAVRGVQTAEEGEAQAHRTVLQAQDQLTLARARARREVEDLRAAVERSTLSEEGARIALRRAQRELLQTIRDPAASGLDVREAQFAVKEAQLGLEDARRGAQRARQDAARGTDTVKVAARQLADARRNEARATDAVKVANEGVAQANQRVRRASEAASAAQEAQGTTASVAQQKLAQLSAAERQALTSFQGFARRFRSTFQPATDAIFGAFSDAMDRLGPPMQRLTGRFTGLGRTVAGIVRHAADSLAGPEWTRAFDAFAGTAQRITRPIANSIGSVLEALRNIAVAAQPFVVDLAHGIEDALGGLARRTSNVRDVRDVIRDLVKHTKSWMDLFGAVGKLLFTVFNGGAEHGRSLVNTMTRLINHWTDFLNTRRGQREMREFFVNSIQVTGDLAQALGEIIKIVLAFWRAYTHVADAFDAADKWIAANTAAWRQWRRQAIADSSDAILGFATTMLGALSSIASALGHLPGGGKFKDIADAIDNARDKMDRYRESLRKTDDAHHAANQQANRNVDGLARLRDAYVTARDRQDKLKKGTDEYRQAAQTTRARQDDLREAVQRMADRANRGKGPVRDLKVNVDQLGNVTADTASTVKDNLNAVLGAVGAKKIDFSVKSQRTGRSNAAAYGGARQFATGGVPNPGSGWHDDHMLLDPTGRPVALMSGTEGILNRPQMGVVDRALQVAQALGAVPWGSLGELWGSGMRHYAAGGTLDRLATGGYVQGASPVTGGAIRADVQALFQRGFNVTSGYRSNSGTYHGAGMAADFGDSANNLRALWRILFPQRARFAELFGPTYLPAGGLYHGTSKFIDPALQADHQDHIHIADPGGGGGGRFTGTGVNGGGMTLPHITAPDIRGPSGPLRDAARGAARVMTRAANRYLDRQSARNIGAPTGSGAAGTAQMRQWARAGLEAAGVPATAHNVALIVARMQFESSGNPRAINLTDTNAQQGHPSKGLMQLIDANFQHYRVRSLPNNTYSPVANVAAGVRYMLGRYGHLVGSTGVGYNLGGLLPGFQFGGSLGGIRARRRSLARPGAARWPFGFNQYQFGIAAPASENLNIGRSAMALYKKAFAGGPQDADIPAYNALDQSLTVIDREYQVTSRRYGQTDEQLVNDAGEVDEGAVRQRAAELQALADIQQRTVRTLQRMRRIVVRTIATYTRLATRLRAALLFTRGHRAARLRRDLASVMAAVAGPDGWQGKLDELDQLTIPMAQLDVSDTLNERATVLGTQPTATPGDTGAGGTGAADPSADAQAQTNQALARAAALQHDLGAARASLAAFGGPADIGGGLGGNAFQAAFANQPVGTGALGGFSAAPLAGGFVAPGQAAGGAAGQLGAGGVQVVVNYQGFVAPTGAQLQAMGQGVVGALDAVAAGAGGRITVG